MNVDMDTFADECDRIAEKMENISQSLVEQMKNMSMKELEEIAGREEELTNQMIKKIVTQLVFDWMRLYDRFAEEDDKEELNSLLRKEFEWL